jgi:putative DNA primase/helicase
MKRCGKTTLLDVISRLVLRPLPTGSVTAAALFRVVEGYRPTLLVDEADTFLSEADELRGVLNSGHRKGGQVVRTVGDDHEPRTFSTFAAVTIAIIGNLPDTLADRSITVDLKRRMPSEKVASFRFDRVGHLDVLARQAARWAQDHAGTISAADPKMPGIHNREADNWAPLLAIADAAGGAWPERARAAAAAGHVAGGDEASLIELLLGDIRDIFAKREENRVEPVDRIPSADLVEALVGIEGRPWAELGRNRKPLTQNGLARRLKPLAITSENIRIGDKVPKGYLLVWFQEAFSRYLGSEGASEPLQRNNADEMGTSAGFQTATADPDVAVGKSEKSNNDGLCYGVAVGKGGKGNGRASSLSSDGLGISTRRIVGLSDEYQERAYANSRETGGDTRTAECDAWLRQKLADEGVLPEHIETEFQRVMAEVFRV